MTRRPTCRHCPGRPQYPNPIKLRAHVLEDHPEKRHAIDAGKLITPVRGPRPGGQFEARVRRTPESTMIDPCPRVIHWWDIDTDSRCTRDHHHAGDHTDGDRWWDGHGLRTPQDPPPAKPVTSTREPYRPRLTNAQATEIRRQRDAGDTHADIARRFNVSDATVWQITHRRTYRSAS